MKTITLIAILGLAQSVKIGREAASFSAADTNHNFDGNNFMTSTEQEDF